MREYAALPTFAGEASSPVPDLLLSSEYSRRQFPACAGSAALTWKQLHSSLLIASRGKARGESGNGETDDQQFFRTTSLGAWRLDLHDTRSSTKRHTSGLDTMLGWCMPESLGDELCYRHVNSRSACESVRSTGLSCVLQTDGWMDELRTSERETSEHGWLGCGHRSSIS